LTYFLRTHIRSSAECFVNGIVKNVNWTKQINKYISACLKL